MANTVAMLKQIVARIKQYGAQYQIQSQRKLVEGSDASDQQYEPAETQVITARITKREDIVAGDNIRDVATVILAGNSPYTPTAGDIITIDGLPFTITQVEEEAEGRTRLLYKFRASNG